MTAQENYAIRMAQDRFRFHPLEHIESDGQPKLTEVELFAALGVPKDKIPKPVFRLDSQ